MELRRIVFKAEGWYYDEKQGKDYPYPIEVAALLDADGQTLIVTDVIRLDP